MAEAVVASADWHKPRDRKNGKHSSVKSFIASPNAW
jgi:hypothetical protein